MRSRAREPKVWEGGEEFVMISDDRFSIFQTINQACTCLWVERYRDINRKSPPARVNGLIIKQSRASDGGHIDNTLNGPHIHEDTMYMNNIRDRER